MNSKLLALMTPIAAVAPSLSECSYAQLASCEVEVETLGEYWEATPSMGATTTQLISNAATPSKVKFSHGLVFHGVDEDDVTRPERDRSITKFSSHLTRVPEQGGSASSGGQRVPNGGRDCEPQAETGNTLTSLNKTDKGAAAHHGGGLGDISGGETLAPARSAGIQRVELSIQKAGEKPSCEETSEREHSGCSSASYYLVAPVETNWPPNSGAQSRSSASQENESV